MPRGQDRSVLVIDDVGLRGRISACLETLEFTILQASNAEEGLAVFRREQPDLVLTNLCLPSMSGLDLITTIADEAPETPVIVVSGTGVLADAIEAVRRGAWDYVTKPFEDLDTMRHVISLALERAGLKQENRQHQEHLEAQVRLRTAELENANQALRDSEARWRALVENAPNFVTTVNRDGRIEFINRTVTGISIEHAIGDSVYTYIHPEHRERVRAAIEYVFETGQATSYESQAEGPRHKMAWYAVQAGPVVLDGRVVAATLVSTDITPHKEAEQEHLAYLRFLKSLEKVNRVIRSATDLKVMLHDVLNTVLEDFNCDRAWLLYPCDPEAPTYRVPVEVTRLDYPGAYKQDLDVPMKPGADEVCRVLLAADGPVTFAPEGDYPLYQEVTEQFGVRSQMIMDVHPKVGKPWMFGMHQCSYPRVWTGEERRLFKEVGRRLTDGLSSLLFLQDLQASEERYKGLVANLPGAVYRCDDRTGTLAFISDAIEEISGYPASDFLGSAGRGYTSIIHADDRDMVHRRGRESVTRRGPYVLEYRIVCADGQVRWVHDRGQAVMGADNAVRTLDGAIFDITQRKQAEEEKVQLEAQLRQAQKMEAFGQLAGGVAHDFNNILTAILGNVEISLNVLDEQSPVAARIQQGLQQIERSAQRAARLTRQLLAFSRRQVVQPTVLNINQALTEMEQMLRRLLSEDINLKSTQAPDLGSVCIDAGQFEQIVMNLVVNARDAIRNGGRVWLETTNVTVDKSGIEKRPDTPPGPYVMFSVSDTGCGMDTETVERIFEPFFTTKAAGYGTGLGLATVYGIVQQNSGHIEVRSELGKGTTIKVFLPVVETPVEVGPADADLNEMPTGTETVLVCEDDETVCKLTTQLLTSVGYEVLDAGNGDEALDLAAHNNRIDLLLTDVIMPNMNGRQLSDLLGHAHPNLKTLYISGYTADVIAHHGVLDDGIEFLEKPFSRSALLRRVRQVLDKLPDGVTSTPR
ncbi:MAG: response regulator [Planctomycetota bacterium]